MPIRTMIVDDEPRIRRGIQRLVLALGEGWEVVGTAGDGKEALSLIDGLNGAVDLVITDVKMPEMDGLELIRELGKSYSCRTLLISGFDDFVYVQAALREGALDYILKPVDRDQFRSSMTQLGDTIRNDRFKLHKQAETEREAEKLKKSRQVQTLSYIASANIDSTALGYGVDEFPKGSYLLLLVRLDAMPVKTRAYTSRDWKAYYYALENIVAETVESEMLGSGRMGWSFLGAESDFWVLLHFPPHEEEIRRTVEGVAEQIRVSIQTFTPFTATIAYGDRIEDLHLLPEARRQAMALVNFRFLHGGNQVFHCAPPLGEPLSGPQEKEVMALTQKLKRYVDQCSGKEALEAVRSLFGLLEKIPSPAHLQASVMNAVILLHTAWLETKLGIGEGISIEDEIRKVKRANSLQELKAGVVSLTERVLDEIRSARRSGSSKPVELAKQWIREHLAEEVTIKKIADHVYLNPTYLSEYFKLQTGETILDYLTTQRMEKARELLGDPELRLQDLSGKVGYQDVKYFSRLFKQKTGMTPSAYRERTLRSIREETKHHAKP
ncbi:response regulator [Paenibacillus sp. RUD330]|nr:response regulator [Paenibacillus sp. RUD330]